MKLPIYLDNHATTPMDPRVFEAMRPYFMERFGNASSSHHAFGWEAEAAVKLARAEVASLVGASPEEIFFTSGVTEANHWVLHGVAESYRDKGSLNQASLNRANHIITCATEHQSILAPCRHLESLGYRVTYLPVDAQGLIDLQELERSLTPDTILVSIMAAHNEVGTLAPLEEIGRLARSRGSLFHTDVAQACGKIPIDVHKMGIDLMSISAHKMYGPKGIGALYVRRHQPHVRLAPLLRGGGQERGWRAGTLNVPAIVGLGKACEVVDLQKEMAQIGRLRDKLYAGLVAGLNSIVLNGHPTRRLPGNLNVSFLGVASDALMGALPDIAVSSGSACSSGSAEPSYVLRAMGVGDERARSSIRFGLGRFTTEEEVAFTLRQVAAKVRELRKEAPLSF